VANEERQPASGLRSPLTQLLREALSRLASPEVSERILAEALRGAGLREVPQDPPSFGSFACGALSDAIEEALGPEAADAVLTDLGPAFVSEEGDASSGVRRRKRHSLAPPRDDAPVVLVASAKPASVDALVPRLRDRAKVVAAYDIFALLQAAQKYLASSRSLTLLLDDEMPAIRPATLATLARLLPPGTRVIAWGAGEVVPEARDRPTSVEWIRMGPVEELDAVADMCLSVLPQPADAAPAPTEAPKILVAHDDARWRARLSRALSEAGYEALSAPDGFMALERCIDETPAAVVAGLEMSTLDGAQLAALLRSRFGADGPPVILVVDGPLPDPPAGVVGLVRGDAGPDELLAEVRVWAGPGADREGSSGGSGEA
jgi:CheY-like chemotaxis protein